MSKLKKLFMLSMLSVYLLATPTNVYATDVGELETPTTTKQEDPNDTDGDENTPYDVYNSKGEYVIQSGDAITDIMTAERFNGAVRSINFITEFIDIWFIRIISATAFFIISAALLKNVCAGAYVANSKFWDKVADAHAKKDAISVSSVKQFFAGGQGVMNTTVGGVRDFLLCIVPNIKAFTDFEDADIEPKAYFMKAIPQMCICVIIGIFIYNGYYRETAATVGETGSVVVTRVLGSVNPEGLVDTLFNTTGWPAFPTKNDASIQGRAEYAMSTQVKAAVASKCKDIKTSEQKANAINCIANAVRNTTATAFAEPFYSSTGVGNLAGEQVNWTIAGVKAVNSSYLGNENGSSINVLEPDERGNIYFTAYLRYGGTCGEGSLGIASNDVTATDCVVLTGYFKQELAEDVAGSSNTKLTEPANITGTNLGALSITVPCSDTQNYTVDSQDILDAIVNAVGATNRLVTVKVKGQTVGTISGTKTHVGASSVKLGSASYTEKNLAIPFDGGRYVDLQINAQ